MVRALRSQTNVTVDLTELAFADSSLIVDLAVLARRLRAGGRAILVRGAQPQVMVLIKHIGLHRLPAVRVETPWPAFI